MDTLEVDWDQICRYGSICIESTLQSSDSVPNWSFRRYFFSQIRFSWNAYLHTHSQCLLNERNSRFQCASRACCGEPLLELSSRVRSDKAGSIAQMLETDDPVRT
jgi:hypothetical protein